MKLHVTVVEARNLPAMDPNGLCDPYVKLHLGKQKGKTKVVKKCLNPQWSDEFSFRVDDLKNELVVSVMDEDKYFNDDFVGQLKIPVSQVLNAENSALGTAWYPLLPKSKKSKIKDCGEILLTVYLAQNKSIGEQSCNCDHATTNVRKQMDSATSSPARSFSDRFRSPSPMRSDEIASSKEDKSQAQKFAGRIAQIFNKNADSASSTSGKSVSPSPERPISSKYEVVESPLEGQSSAVPFEEIMKTIDLKDQGREVPSDLPGGILLDQLYLIASADLNSLIFAPGSEFSQSAADAQGTTELQQGPWILENDGESMKRVVTYTKAATKLIKAVKGIEEQTYLKADGKAFAVLASVSTPDAPYGSTFRTELLFCITPGPELPSGEQCSRLVISWRMNFIQSTIMKGMIEGGARQGLKDSFEPYAALLSQTVKVVDAKDMGSNKDQALASLQVESQPDWKLALQYFANFTVISTVVIGLYVLVHIFLAMPGTIQGLEFVGLDLPDSIGEVIVSGVLILQTKQVLELISRFMQARVQKGSDHGVKAQGDGWLLTVALIEGNNLSAVDSSGFSDPYVVFTCNGKARTSSIKFQKSDPHWNEIFEFDAMDEPPSMLDVEVYDFDGPFDEAMSLGHAEINFVRSNLIDLADVWIPLQGQLAQACQSKLHLRIFLDNTRGTNSVNEYLTKVEKEVGKKINLRSPQTNTAFQKLFGLPPEEFLINDFRCHLKRKMPLQGRLFLSPRIIGFYTNMFGHKTKFFFLWEDIEDIQQLSPTLSSMGSPIIIITLRKGRGIDARHGAKTQDFQRRLKFHFQSFVSFGAAHRTIMALWKARSLSPEQKVQIVEEESESKSLQTEESGAFLDLEDVNMSEVYCSVLSVPSDYFMEIFNGGDLDHKVIEKAGCLEYSNSPWELEKPDVYQRQIQYKFDKHISRYGGGVTSTQQRSPLPDGKGWIIEEVMTLDRVPLGDYFNLHMRYQVEDLPSRLKACNVQVLLGLAWLKSTGHQKRITKNVVSNVKGRMKVIFSVVEKEYLSVK
ncbi:GRAM domain [Dillenia turbinata]|uniref:GRAM domain n=1 Tax=Dillenia turbinata TaxID=194707 RepID=A0AAN8ZCK8_9MAGN